MAPSPPLASAGGAGAASSGRRGRRARPRRQGRRGVAQRTRTPNPARSRPRAVPGTSATVRRPPTITTLPASRAAGPAGVELCALWPAGSAGAPSLLARVVGRAWAAGLWAAPLGPQSPYEYHDHLSCILVGGGQVSYLSKSFLFLDLLSPTCLPIEIFSAVLGY